MATITHYGPRAVSFDCPTCFERRIRHQTACGLPCNGDIESTPKAGEVTCRTCKKTKDHRKAMKLLADESDFSLD